VVATAFRERVQEIEEQAELTHDEVAEIVGTSGRTVSRWGTGATVPQPDARKRLLELAYVSEQLAKVLKEGERNAWLFSPNRLLDHDTPADRIAKGDYRSVMALIEAMADGIVV
jgi:transcriptional regulator with XRE-family HTH domain